MNLTAIKALAAQDLGDMSIVLQDQVGKIETYPDDKPYLAEEIVPILSIMIALDKAGQQKELVDQAWTEMFKGGAKFNRSYITANLDAGNEKFMKYLDIAIHSANPEHSHQVGLGKPRG